MSALQNHMDKLDDNNNVENNMEKSHINQSNISQLYVIIIYHSNNKSIVYIYRCIDIISMYDDNDNVDHDNNNDKQCRLFVSFGVLEEHHTVLMSYS